MDNDFFEDKMKFEFDKESDAAYIYLKFPIREGEVNKTTKLNENIVLDYDKKGYAIVDSRGKKHKLTDPDVEVIVPPMDELGTESFAAVFQSLGMNAIPLKTADYNTLKAGRGNTSCKECLPIILTTGAMVDYVEKNNKNGKIIVYFMPQGAGPCRQGQYAVFMNNLIRTNKLENTVVLSLNDEKSYAGLGTKFALSAWKAVVLADVLADVKNALKVLAVDKEKALEIFGEEWSRVILHFKENRGNFYSLLKDISLRLGKIKLKKTINDAKFITLIGESYVRRDPFSRVNLLDKLNDQGFVVRVAPISEYVYYTSYTMKNKMTDVKLSSKEKVELFIRDFYMILTEKRIKKILVKSGLLFYDLVDIGHTIDHSKNFISKHLMGESILTVGFGLREILSQNCCGIISLGPFGCMPSRIAEAILSRTMNLDDKIIATNDLSLKEKYPNLTELPFLAIETDGNLFPQVIEARLETFMLQADRIFEKMVKSV